MIRFTIFITALLISYLVQAQTVGSSMLSSAGDNYTTNDLLYSWTMGDLVIDDLRTDDRSAGVGLGFLFSLPVDTSGGLSTNTYDTHLESIVHFGLSPVPVHDVLKLKINSLQLNLRPSEYRVVDILGRTVISGHMHEEETQIDVNLLPSGTYQIQLFATDNRLIGSRKFIKT